MRKILNQYKKEYKIATDAQIIQAIQMNTKSIQKYKVATDAQIIQEYR